MSLDYRKYAMALTALMCVSIAIAQEKEPQVDDAEIHRRGNMVTISGEGPRGATEEAIIAALAPPEDDSELWFISLMKEEKNPDCDKLLQDFQKAPELTAFVAPGKQTKAWAHFNAYDMKDETQKWRLKEYRVRALPTVIVQPPGNGMWGDPAQVVYQSSGGYNGDPKKLAEEMSVWIKAYIAEMSKRGYPKRASLKFENTNFKPSEHPRYAWLDRHVADYSSRGHGQGGSITNKEEEWKGPNDLPFQQPPPVLPFDPQPQYQPQYPQYPSNPGPYQPQYQPNLPPNLQPQPTNPQPTPAVQPKVVERPIIDGLTKLLMGSGVLLLLLNLLVNAFKAYAATTPSTLDDKIAEIVGKILSQMQQNQQVQNANAPLSRG